MRTMAMAALLVLASASAHAMTLTSPDFENGGTLPPSTVYPRCGGQNISPELHWSGVPAGARSLVLTMIDESVRPNEWSHWIVVDLPPSSTGLARGVATLPGSARAVASNFGDAAYGGPCPPKGTGTHRYVFTIWAMPGPSTAIAPDGKASDIAPMLARTALDRASIAGTVTP